MSKKMISLMIDHKNHEELRHIGFNYNKSISAVIRVAIEEYIAKEKEKKKK